MAASVAIHIDPELNAELDSLAETTQRSKTSLANEALHSFIVTNAAYAAEIHASMKEADEVGTVPHGEVDAWMASWGTVDELPMPTVKPRG
jgi:RHH-type rel operon transcriptional repressor/antitoxin RelB